MTVLRALLRVLTPGRALFLALAVAVVVQTWRLQALETEYAAAEGALSVERTRVEALGAQLAAQNAAIAQLKAAGDAQVAALAEAQAEADRLREATRERVERIKSTPIADGCEAAVDWLTEMAKTQSHLWK